MGSTTISRLARQSDLPTTGLNDGRVDHSGRFIWGGMDEATDKQPISAMYRWTRPTDSRTIDAVHISNSICFSPDRTQMYFTDMPSGQILVYSDDTDLGVPHDPKIFADLSDQPGLADGSTIERPTTSTLRGCPSLRRARELPRLLLPTTDLSTNYSGNGKVRFSRWDSSTSSVLSSNSWRPAPFESGPGALKTREYWARIGHGRDVINFSRARIIGTKVTLTRHFGTSRDDDHGIQHDQPGYSCHLVVRITRHIESPS